MWGSKYGTIPSATHDAELLGTTSHRVTSPATLRAQTAHTKARSNLTSPKAGKGFQFATTGDPTGTQNRNPTLQSWCGIKGWKVPRAQLCTIPKCTPKTRERLLYPAATSHMLPKMAFRRGSPIMLMKIHQLQHLLASVGTGCRKHQVRPHYSLAST